MSRFFVTGIGTDVGKTIASAILTQALGAEYWKPVQCGDVENSDSIKIKRFLGNSETVIHPEAYIFSEAVSPHLAAQREGRTIKMDGFHIPETRSEHLIIEGAGGILVPMNNDAYVIDLAREFEADVILVCNNYVGCINHSLLSIEWLVQNNYPLKGLVMNGQFDKEVYSKITGYAEVPVLLNIPVLSEIDASQIQHIASTVDLNLFAE